MESEALLARVRQGDANALEELLARHLPGLRAFVRLQCGPVVRDRESVSDVVQSTCREVIAHLDRFEHGGDREFRQWLYTSAMRKIRHRAAYWRADRRDIGRERAASMDDVADRALVDVYGTITTPSAEVQGREFLTQVEGAFDRLSDDEREAILLARVLGLSHLEVAAQTGRTEGASRTLLHRALVKLARLLDPGGAAPEDTD